MWALKNETPFAAERTWVRDINGAEIWLVAVRATYTICEDGGMKLAEHQEPVVRVPKYLGDPGQSSLLCESDLVRTKRTTDILLHGGAYAPGGRPIKEVDVMLKVGDTIKIARVFGNRVWRQTPFGLSPTEAEAFVHMPITYERAFGGVDLSSPTPLTPERERRNPVGVGFATAAHNLVGRPLPNIEDPRQLISCWHQRPCPIGFGPIARDWSPRIEFAGTYDNTWDNERRPLLPLDFDDRFFHSALLDQQTPRYLRGGERVELFQLTPSGYCRLDLPCVSLGFITWIAGEWRPHEAKLHTVLIQPQIARLTLTWHTSLPCHHEIHKLRWTRIFEKRKLARS